MNWQKLHYCHRKQRNKSGDLRCMLDWLMNENKTSIALHSKHGAYLHCAQSITCEWRRNSYRNRLNYQFWSIKFKLTIISSGNLCNFFKQIADYPPHLSICNHLFVFQNISSMKWTFASIVVICFELSSVESLIISHHTIIWLKSRSFGFITMNRELITAWNHVCYYSYIFLLYF